MMTMSRSNQPQPENTGSPRGIAVITGAGSGIGRAIVLELAKSGVACCLVGRTLSKLEEVARLTARAGVKSIPMVADLGDLGAVAALAQRICSSRRRIDGLRQEVNAFGVRVISVFPGRTATPLQASLFELEGRQYAPTKLLQPEDVAAMVVQALALPPTAEVTDILIRPAIKS